MGSESRHPADPRVASGSAQITADEADTLLALVRQLNLTTSRRQALTGTGGCVGLSFAGVAPFVTPVTRTKEGGEFAKAANRLLGRHARSLFLPRWSSIQVNYNTTAHPHVDSNNTGNSVLLLLGSFAGGEFGYTGTSIKYSAVNTFFTIDGSAMHESAAFRGERVSIIYFLHKSEAQAPPSDRQFLAEVGFQLQPGEAPPRAELRPAEGWGNPSGAQIKRAAPLRGLPEKSAKERKEEENRHALGGMRRPHRAVAQLPQALAAGAVVRKALDEALDEQCGRADQVVLDILRGKKVRGFTDPLVRLAKYKVAKALGTEAREKGGLSAGIIRSFSTKAGDPDGILADWAEGGAPLGIVNEVVSTGVFPTIGDPLAEPDEVMQVTTPEGPWSNYVSAESSPEITAEILNRMVNKGWAIKAPSLEALAEEVGSNEIALNKLALISKMKADNTMKHRLVWDLLRSGVNSVVRQGERVILPKLYDLIEDILDLLRSATPGEEVYVLGADIEDAFHQIPLRRNERRFTAASISGWFFAFTVLVFGSGSAPTVWGRYASWLARSTIAIAQPGTLRMEIYVDDPVYVAKGTLKQVARTFARALLWCMVVGLPIAWAKAEGGSQVRWIGAAVTFTPSEVVAFITEDKIQEILELISTALSKNKVSARFLRSLAGKLNFIAGIVPKLRPFLASIWAAIAGPTHPSEDEEKSLASAPGHCSSSDRVVGHLVWTKSCKQGLVWCEAFLRGCHGGLRRHFRVRPPGADDTLTVSVDASPWGIGGLLTVNTVPQAWFSDELHEEDLKMFEAERGESAFTTIWELLAVVVAIKLWAADKIGLAVAVRSDSLSALQVLARNRARAPGLTILLQELALEQASFSFLMEDLTHIPGVSNKIPDALSRLKAPGEAGKPFPTELAHVHRSEVPRRDSSFWRIK